MLDDITGNIREPRRFVKKSLRVSATLHKVTSSRYMNAPHDTPSILPSDLTLIHYDVKFADDNYVTECRRARRRTTSCQYNWNPRFRTRG